MSALQGDASIFTVRARGVAFTAELTPQPWTYTVVGNIFQDRRQPGHQDTTTSQLLLPPLAGSCGREVQEPRGPARCQIGLGGMSDDP